MTKNAVAVFVRITSVHLEIQKRCRTETILDYDTIRLERLRAISCAVGTPLAYSDLFDATNREV